MIKSKYLEEKAPKEVIFEKLENELNAQGLKISQKDVERPWGGFFVVDENQIQKFKKIFFNELVLEDEQFKRKLSPKLLLVAPNKRLSWQYHNRRAEVWKLIEGKASIVRSNTDKQGPVNELKIGEMVHLNQGERHRLVGRDSWGIIAEIWIHTDRDNPSNEEDIIRVEDDFSRK
jgi:mannose-6-phosphate isomerase-like protein (cupin superfamily)